MIGTDLNLVLPSLSESMATNISRIATALSQIEDSIAQKATPAGLNINAPLDLQGNALTNTTSVQLLPGNIPSIAGSIYYYNGEFYLIDGTGTIQLTANGALNSASVGGIGGDYGGVNPASVVFDDASGEYRFMEDNAPTWADLKAHDVVLMEGGTGYVRLGVDAAITTGRSFFFKSLPSAGVSPLVYNASTSTLEDGAVTRATNTALFTGIDATGNVTANDFKHSDVTTTLGLESSWFETDFGEIVGPGAAIAVEPYRVIWTDNARTLRIRRSLPLKVGDRLKSFTITLNKRNTSPTTIEIHKNALPQSVTGDTSVVTSGTGTYTVTLSSPAAVVAGDVWSVEIQGPAAASGGDWYYGAYMVHDRP